MTPEEVFAFLRQWAPHIWTLFSVVGLAVVAYLWARTRDARRKLQNIAEGEEGAVRTTLRHFERLALVVVAVLTALVVVGVMAIASPGPNIGFGIFTLLVLVALPLVLTWIVYRAFRLWLG